jgi:hypothetical protein
LDEEYSIIVNTIEHEKAMLDNKPRFRDVFRGNNLFSPPHYPTLYIS